MAYSNHARSPQSTLRAWCAVLTVALAVFAVTVTEMMPVGLIPQIAADLHVSDGAAGLTVSAYGVIAGLSAPTATAWTHRVDRRILLLAVLTVLIVGNLATAAATSYPVLLVVRLAMGLAHGLMWSITAPIAVRLVAPASAATATAAAFSGISLALVLGVPAGTFLGAWIGWRSAFLSVAVLAPRRGSPYSSLFRLCHKLVHDIPSSGGPCSPALAAYRQFSSSPHWR